MSVSVSVTCERVSAADVMNDDIDDIGHIDVCLDNILYMCFQC